MPNMIEGRYKHKSVAVKNKLFVIGGLYRKCEVFDSTTEKFTLLKQPMSNDWYGLSQVITIGSKLFCLKSNINIYDLENDEWSEKPCEATKNIELFSCARIPSKTC